MPPMEPTNPHTPPRPRYRAYETTAAPYKPQRCDSQQIEEGIEAYGNTEEEECFNPERDAEDAEEFFHVSIDVFGCGSVLAAGIDVEAAYEVYYGVGVHLLFDRVMGRNDCFMHPHVAKALFTGRGYDLYVGD